MPESRGNRRRPPGSASLARAVDTGRRHGSGPAGGGCGTLRRRARPAVGPNARRAPAPPPCCRTPPAVLSGARSRVRAAIALLLVRARSGPSLLRRAGRTLGTNRPAGALLVDPRTPVQAADGPAFVGGRAAVAARVTAVPSGRGDRAIKPSMRSSHAGHPGATLCPAIGRPEAEPTREQGGLDLPVGAESLPMTGRWRCWTSAGPSAQGRHSATPSSSAQRRPRPSRLSKKAPLRRRSRPTSRALRAAMGHGLPRRRRREPASAAAC